LRLFTHWVRAAASRTFCTAGTKQSDQDGDDGDHHQHSMSVNPRRVDAAAMMTLAEERMVNDEVLRSPENGEPYYLATFRS